MTAVSSPGGPGVSVPPTAIFVTGYVAGLWWQARTPWFIDPEGLSAAPIFIGTALIGLAVGLFAAGLMRFARVGTGILLQQPATLVVRDGPYGWSRNPQYLSFVAGYLGASILSNAVYPLLILPGVVAALHVLVIAREERYLRQRFAEEYEAYCRQVPRWLWRPSRRWPLQSPPAAQLDRRA